MIAPNPYMASEVNRRTADGGRLSPCEAFQPDCCCPSRSWLRRGRSAVGVSPRLHQTPIPGSAAGSLSSSGLLPAVYQGAPFRATGTPVTHLATPADVPADA